MLTLVLAAAVALSAPERIASAECLSCHRDVAGNSHPFNVRYEGARGKLKRAGEPSGYGGTIAGDLLIDGRIECTSCHVSHDQKTSATARLRDASAALCRACHRVD